MFTIERQKTNLARPETARKATRCELAQYRGFGKTNMANNPAYVSI